MRLSDHCDQDVFRDVMGHFARGVTIVTALHDDVDHGVTANALGRFEPI
jgi:flavin reductase (DIM6/NTAB) family NADH-FMN oxidoreductase RutF